MQNYKLFFHSYNITLIEQSRLIIIDTTYKQTKMKVINLRSPLILFLLKYYHIFLNNS